MTKLSLEQCQREWKQRNCIDTSVLEWFCIQTAELEFFCMRDTENPQESIELDQQLHRNPVVVSILIIIITNMFSSSTLGCFFVSISGERFHFWLLLDRVWKYSACRLITPQNLQDDGKQASTARLMTKAAAARTCPFTSVFPSSEADDGIHTAVGESTGQRLNSLLITWNDYFGLMEPGEAASFNCSEWLTMANYALVTLKTSQSI